MATMITDNDLKMFQERAKTEFASRCDTGGIAWDSVIWDLCNEVRRLRGVSKESGDAAKLREALRKINNLCGIGVVEISSFEIGSICDAALAAPPRNCDMFSSYSEACDYWHEHVECVEINGCFDVWLFEPATEKEGGAK